MLTPNIDYTGKTVLVTGAAGFIGAALTKKLLQVYPNIRVIGIDNMNDYYDPSLKEARLKEIEKTATGSRDGSFALLRGSIADRALIDQVFASYCFAAVVNLAAQAGVRYSITNPDAYIESNLIGFYNILEACRRHGTEHLIYASSSSVYGENTKIPYATEDKTDAPVSLYAATKKSNELMAHSYAKLYDIPSTGLRFFTVYGPAGRPDMAYFSFAEKLRKGEKIRIFNHGNCLRDFTYVDDIVEGVLRVMTCAPLRQRGNDGLPVTPHRVYNIGNSHPEKLLDFVDTLARALVEEGVLPATFDLQSHMELVPMQPGDVPATYADTKPLLEDFGFSPSTPLQQGLRRFAAWYRTYCDGMNRS